MRLRNLHRSVDSVGVDPVDSVGVDPVDSVGLDRVHHLVSGHPKRPTPTDAPPEVCASYILNFGADAPLSVDSVGLDRAPPEVCVAVPLLQSYPSHHLAKRKQKCR